MRRILPILVSLVACAACVPLPPGPPPEAYDQIAQYVSREPVEAPHPLDVEFEHGLELYGYALTQAPAEGGEPVEVEAVAPGRPFQVTWYWHVREDLDSQHLLFTHAVDGAGRNRENLDNAGVLRRGGLYQPGAWRPGEYIRDVQEITIDNWGSDELSLFLGVYRGSVRLGIVGGATDGNGRARDLTIPVRG